MRGGGSVPTSVDYSLYKRFRNRTHP